MNENTQLDNSINDLVRTLWTNQFNRQDKCKFHRKERGQKRPFFENQGEQTCQTIEHFNKDDPAKNFGNKKTTFYQRKLLSENYIKTNMKVFH